MAAGLVFIAVVAALAWQCGIFQLLEKFLSSPFIHLVIEAVLQEWKKQNGPKPEVLHGLCNASGAGSITVAEALDLKY